MTSFPLYNASVIDGKLGNATLFPWEPLFDADCAAANSGSALQKQECFIGNVIYPFVQFPTFNHISLTDQVISQQRLGVPAVTADTPADVIDYLVAYANATRYALAAAKVTAGFSEMCYEHTALGSGMVSPVTVLNVGVLQALADFYYDRATVHLIDCCTEFNCNPSCLNEVCPTSAGTCGPYVENCPDILASTSSTSLSSSGAQHAFSHTLAGLFSIIMYAAFCSK